MNHLHQERNYSTPKGWLLKAGSTVLQLCKLPKQHGNSSQCMQCTTNVPSFTLLVCFHQILAHLCSVFILHPANQIKNKCQNKQAVSDKSCMLHMIQLITLNALQQTFSLIHYYYLGNFRHDFLGSSRMLVDRLHI